MIKIFKSLLILSLALAVLVSFSAVSAAEDSTGKKEGKEDKDPNEFKVYWKDGIRLDSNDGKFKLKAGGRIMSDWLWGTADEGIEDHFGEIVSGNEFRRARLYVSGTIYGNVEFKAQYDFAGGDADIKDMYVGIKGLPIGSIRAGHFKAGFSLEELTSSKYITFMERALSMTFVPSRETGFAIIGAAGEKKREFATWHFGLYTDADDYGNAVAYDDSYIFAGRITYLPWVDGKNLFHVGGGMVWKDIPEEGYVRFRERAENHLLSRYVDTHSFAADSTLAFNVEAAFIMNSLHGAFEYFMMQVDSPDYNDPEFQGFYAYAGYFLTGETRAYKREAGTFNRNKPKEAFSKDGGMGAWEIAFRYSWIDLNDTDVMGGELTDITAALNWYLNNNTVIKFNWVYADVAELDSGTANIFMARFQVDF
jgi:phosphate-selective porin OprO/OprP